MQMRDEFGVIYDDQMFASVYPVRGQGAIRLAGSQRCPGTDRLVENSTRQGRCGVRVPMLLSVRESRTIESRRQSGESSPEIARGHSRPSSTGT